MTGRISRSAKYTLCFFKICIFLKNSDFVEKILEKIGFFFAILTFFMAALDAQQNFMPTRYLFFFLSLLDQKL